MWGNLPLTRKAPYKVLDAGNDKTLCRLNWPASKKRQGTKSREVGHRRSSECYEVLDLGNSKSGGLECAHNLSVLARLLLNRGFDFVGPCDFK